MKKTIRLSESQLQNIIEKVISEQSPTYQELRRERMRKNVDSTHSNETEPTQKKDTLIKQHDPNKRFNKIFPPADVTTPEGRKKILNQPTQNIFTDFDSVYDYKWEDQNKLWFTRRKSTPEKKWINISHLPTAVDKLNKKYGKNGRKIGLQNQSQKPIPSIPPKKL